MDGFETFAQIDLGALERNLDAIRSRVEFRKILLPIKANAYGHGLIDCEPGSATQAPLAAWLEQHHSVDWFGVATVEEGVHLRAAGISLPILKLSPAQNHQLGAAIAAGLTLTVVDPVTIWAASAAAEAADQAINVHLKIDTGMRRIGCPPVLAPRLAELIDQSPLLHLQAVYTHFASAENPAEDEFTRRQIQQFNEAVDGIEQLIGRGLELKHAANSAAVERHPDSWYDMVRPGILSYGYPQSQAASTEAWSSGSGRHQLPTGGLQARSGLHVDPVLSLVSHISFVKTVHAGETVSYGRRWVAGQDTRVATIPVGYGDGYLRGLSNRAQVAIAGRLYPQIGTICMDQMMIDLGPESTIGVGEPVTLIGRDGSEFLSAAALAQQADTISYELLCGIADRVPRVYIG
ncbi:MAG: alanine racemase [Propionibacteriaceae bacterium]|jgi:alanine racemase|nr:alanine racemase [Propionibacteriaceae bacterium]